MPDHTLDGLSRGLAVAELMVSRRRVSLPEVKYAQLSEFANSVSVAAKEISHQLQAQQTF